VSYGYPQAAPTAGYAAPACCPTAAVEPGCAYVDPYMGGMMSYGPIMSSGCDTCGTGYTGTIMSSPMPAQVMPGPAE
jgi:hypothetical protein